MWWFNRDQIPTELHKFYWVNQGVVEYWEHSYLHGWRRIDNNEVEHGNISWKSGMPYHEMSTDDEDYEKRLHKHPMIQW